LKEIKNLAVKPHASLKLVEIDPDNTLGRNKNDVENELVDLHSTLSQLQYRLYIENKKALLIILQGMDASGKDGTIKHVMGAFHPLGCRVESFKVPTTEELAYDFLWRIHKVVPRKGFVGVFNRSHYEDVIEVRVQNLAPRSVWSQRYDHINQFEKILTLSDTKIIKFFLHISKEEQKERLLERLSDPDKRWKVDEGDFTKRKKWGQYMKAYSDVLNRCSVANAPWFVIPANKKWFRNWVISKIIVETLQELNIKYPAHNYRKNKLIMLPP
jgi:PPK2 family polyphosphate:nucleotide phosphotransferase